MSTFREGMNLMTVVWFEGRPIAATAKVQCVEPPVILTQEDVFLDLRYPRPVTLLWTHESRMIRSESQIKSAAREGEWIRLEVDFVNAGELDRRKHPRIPVEAPVALRTISEGRDKKPIELYQGSSRDISLGGAWVSMTNPPAKGTAVEFIARPEGLPQVRVYALVTHSQDDGVGVAFIEPFASALDSLNTWINEVA